MGRPLGTIAKVQHPTCTPYLNHMQFVYSSCVVAKGGVWQNPTRLLMNQTITIAWLRACFVYKED